MATSSTNKENVNKLILTVDSMIKIMVFVLVVIKDFNYKEIVVFQQNNKLEIQIVINIKMEDVLNALLAFTLMILIFVL